MKHLYTFLFFSFLSVAAYATSVTKNIDVDGQTRKYIVYFPSNYVDTDTLPLLVFLHPNGFSASEFAETYKMEEVCEMAKSIVLVPEAMDEQSSTIKSLYAQAQSLGVGFAGMSVTNVWGAGASVKTDELTSKLGSLAPLFSMLYPDLAAAGKIQFNKDVDDVKFINAMIDEMETSYKVDQDRLFMIGASMGGAMTYKYAYSDGSKIKGAAVICGFVGAEVDTIGKSLDIPLCVFHSQSDSVVAYDGGMLGGPIPSTVAAVASANGCSDYQLADVADVADDGFKIKTYSYDCDSTKRVLFYSIDKSAHADFLVSDYTTGPNDIDYYYEVYKFLFGVKIPNAVEDNRSMDEHIYPNPATDYLHTSLSGHYRILSQDGMVVKTGVVDGQTISVSDLAPGLYIFVLENEEGSFVSKISKR